MPPASGFFFKKRASYVNEPWKILRLKAEFAEKVNASWDIFVKEVARGAAMYL